MMNALRGKSLLEDKIRLRKTLFTLAGDPLRMGMNVGEVRQGKIEVLVIRQIFMKGRRVRRRGITRAVDGLELLILDIDAGERFVGDLLRLRPDNRYPLADESHPVAREHRHVFQSSSHEPFGDIRGGKNRAYAFELFRPLDIEL